MVKPNCSNNWFGTKKTTSKKTKQEKKKKRKEKGTVENEMEKKKYLLYQGNNLKFLEGKNKPRKEQNKERKKERVVGKTKGHQRRVIDT